MKAPTLFPIVNYCKCCVHFLLSFATRWKQSSVQCSWSRCTRLHPEMFSFLLTCNTVQASDNVRLGEQLSWRIHSCTNRDCRCLCVLGNDASCSPLIPGKGMTLVMDKEWYSPLWQIAPLLPGHGGLSNESVKRDWCKQMRTIFPEHTKPKVWSPAQPLNSHPICSS